MCRMCCTTWATATAWCTSPPGRSIPCPRQNWSTTSRSSSAASRNLPTKKGLHYDLIHSHYWLSGVAAEQLQLDWQVPIVQMFHTLVMMKNRIARTPEEMEGEYRLEGEQRVLKLADRIIVSTLAEQSQLEFLYRADASKLVIIPPGVDTARFYPIPKDEAKAAIELPPNEQMILFVGRIEPLKGVDTLLRALAYIRSTNNLDCCPHYLAIIGGDPEVSEDSLNAEMARVKALSAELGLSDIVLFLGKRSQESLPYYYSAADVVVVPSHYESFGMVALEAMACGTPVVASQVGGLAFLVQDGVTGFVVPNGEPELLGQHLIETLLDPELRGRLGSQGAEIARGYSWDIIAGRIMAVYNELLNTSPHAHAERRLPHMM